MSLRYAYNTNGCASHRLDDALVLIAEAGYAGVALTLDHHHFDPFAPGLGRRAARLARRLAELGLGCVIETGARFLLDPRVKHSPTLLHPEAAGRAQRRDFLRRALEVARTCEAEALSLWSGARPEEVSPAQADGWLIEGLAELTSQRGQVAIALEPEPGHHVATCAEAAPILDAVPGASLALDMGHCLVTGDCAPDEAARRYGDRLGTVAIEDMRRGIHEHLPFGEGDMDLPACLAALREVGWGGLICVELSRGSARAHALIPESIAALRAAEGLSGPS